MRPNCYKMYRCGVDCMCTDMKPYLKSNFVVNTQAILTAFIVGLSDQKQSLDELRKAYNEEIERLTIGFRKNYYLMPRYIQLKKCAKDRYDALYYTILNF